MDIEPPGPLIQGFATGQIRHVMSLAAGYLVAKGAIQTTDSAEFIAMGSGIVLWAVAACWSWWTEHGHNVVLTIVAKMHPIVPQDATMAEAVRVATQVADAGPA